MFADAFWKVKWNKRWAQPYAWYLQDAARKRIYRCNLYRPWEQNTTSARGELMFGYILYLSNESKLFDIYSSFNKLTLTNFIIVFYWVKWHFATQNNRYHLVLLVNVINLRVLQHPVMLLLVHCLIPNQHFVYTELPCLVYLPVERMVTNSSSTIA